MLFKDYVQKFCFKRNQFLKFGKLTNTYVLKSFFVISEAVKKKYRKYFITYMNKIDTKQCCLKCNNTIEKFQYSSTPPHPISSILNDGKCQQTYSITDRYIVIKCNFSPNTKINYEASILFIKHQIKHQKKDRLNSFES